MEKTTSAGIFGRMCGLRHFYPVPPSFPKHLGLMKELLRLVDRRKEFAA